MKIDKIVDEDGSVINYWEIKSPHTPWWMSEISRDPDDKHVRWINVGYVCPLSTEMKPMSYVLACSAVNYSWNRN